MKATFLVLAAGLFSHAGFGATNIEIANHVLTSAELAAQQATGQALHDMEFFELTVGYDSKQKPITDYRVYMEFHRLTPDGKKTLRFCRTIGHVAVKDAEELSAPTFENICKDYQ